MQPLGPNEYLVCQVCGAEVTDDPPTTEGVPGSGASCPTCGEWGKFVLRNRKRALRYADRWPGLGKRGFVPVPSPLIAHAARLGLDHSDVGLMAAFEDRRIGGADDAVCVRFSTVAAQLGINEKTVRNRVSKWVEAGLWEKRYGRHSDGTNGLCSLTRRGLTLALALIEANLAAGRAADAGLEELLGGLKRKPDRQKVPSRPGISAGRSGKIARAKQEQPEREQELSVRQPEPSARGPLGQDELIRRLKADFGAREITEQAA